MCTLPTDLNDADVDVQSAGKQKHLRQQCLCTTERNIVAFECMMKVADEGRNDIDVCTGTWDSDTEREVQTKHT